MARQKAQEAKLGGLIFNPDTEPSNGLVDLFVEMLETEVLSYVKAEQCCSRSQEVCLMKRDPTIATDSSGLLKVSSKQKDPVCEANAELKLRSALQSRSLALGAVSFLSLVERSTTGIPKCHCSRSLIVTSSYLSCRPILPWES